jgi:hypothetical protein
MTNKCPRDKLPSEWLMGVFPFSNAKLAIAPGGIIRRGYRLPRTSQSSVVVSVLPDASVLPSGENAKDCVI